MMCSSCHRLSHSFFDCQFPQSCTCQHRQNVKKQALIGKEHEPSTGSFTAQEHTLNAADRLEA